jgi:hypothetical protein
MVTMFQNPGIQAAAKLADMFTGKTYVPDPWETHPVRGRVRRAALFQMKAIGSITALSLAMYLRNRNNPYYWELPAQRRDSYWNIALDNKGTFLSLPKPWEVGMIFGALPERIFQYMDTSDPHSFSKWATSLTNVLVPPILPVIAVPVVENWGNKSIFWGTPIVPSYREGLAARLQYRPSTTQVMRIVGGKLGLAPAKLENFVRGYTGTLGVDGLRTLDWSLQAGGLTGKQTGPEDKRLPVVGVFLTNALRESQTVQDMYDRMKAASEVRGSVRLMLKEKKYDDAAAYLREGENQKLYTEFPRLQTAVGLLATLRQEQGKTFRDTKMSDKERKAKTRATLKEMVRIAHQALNRPVQGKETRE